MKARALVIGFVASMLLLFAGTASIGHGDSTGWWYVAASLVLCMFLEIAGGTSASGVDDG